MSDSTNDVNLMPFQDALNLYEEMRQAYYDGDYQRISELQEQYPSLFEEETANLLRSTMNLVNKMKKRKMKFPIH